MGRMVIVGNEDFEELVRDDGYYVDKTEFLYDLFAKTRNKVTLFTRPRRFGKTLTMSMMENFFDIKRNTLELFENLNIYKNHPNFCKEWMNQYPTLFMSFKDIEGLNFDKAYEMLKGEVSKLCNKHSYLENEEKVVDADKEVFHRLLYKTASEEEIKNSLQTIMRMMNAVYGKPVILLIDEYDVPLAKAQQTKDSEYYKKMLDMIRGIMSTSLKTNPYLKFAVITGCLRISKESIFTGVNNFACYSVTTTRFSRYFGFEPDEVKALLAEFKLDDKYELVKKWYDGYIIGNSEVFCPWDVVSYVSSIIEDEDEQPQNFWANTSSNSILDEFVNHNTIDASEKFEALLNGGSITEDISEELTYDHISDSEQNLWSVLLMTGYISKADMTRGTSKLKLRIPNVEIANLFKDKVVDRFKRTLDTASADSFITAMWNGDEKTAEDALNDILWNSISYFDYGEDYYHGLLNGVFTSRGYNVDSNDESGLGRLDLRIKDRPNRRLLLFEFKRSKSKEELTGDCEEAISQIVKNGYDKTMPEGYESQRVYGIAFYGKQARIRKMLAHEV